MTGKHVWVGSFMAVVVIAIALLSAGSPNASASDQPSSPNVDVKIDNFSFGPHTVVSTEGVFKSKVRDTDEKFSYTFTKAGKYPYYCSVHPKMTGQIIVQ